METGRPVEKLLWKSGNKIKAAGIREVVVEMERKGCIQHIFWIEVNDT